MKKSAFYLAIICVGISLSSCKKDDPVEANEEELITTVLLQFNSGANAPLLYEFSDPDGPGGNNPISDNIILEANTQYTLSIRLLDESKTPPVDISEEVEEEANDHRLYLIPGGNQNINSIETTDSDSEGRPLGLKYTITTGSGSQGTLRLVLRHYGNGGKESSDPVDSPKSSTDVDVEFQTAIPE